MGMLEGALILLAGIVIGRVLPGRRRKKAATGGPVCGCGHHHSYHDPETGRCNATRFGDPCKCLSYTGPEPLPEFYAPEIGG